MKITPQQKRRLILKILATTAVQALLFLFLLVHIPLGKIFPDTFKVIAMLGLWMTTVAFLVAHITPEGKIKYKIWSRSK